MRLKVLTRDCPHREGSIQARMWKLIVSMEGRTPLEVTDAIRFQCRKGGWSNTAPARPMQRMLERGDITWELS